MIPAPTTKEREYYEAYKTNVCLKLGITRADYAQLRQIGLYLVRIYERQCNGYLNRFDGKTWDKVAEERDAKMENTYTQKAELFASTLGLDIYFQTDPRGATIYVDNKPIENQNYNYAQCIY